jgi:hypothetical protein
MLKEHDTGAATDPATDAVVTASSVGFEHRWNDRDKRTVRLRTSELLNAVDGNCDVMTTYHVIEPPCHLNFDVQIAGNTRRRETEQQRAVGAGDLSAFVIAHDVKLPPMSNTVASVGEHRSTQTTCRPFEHETMITRQHRRILRSSFRI